MWIEKSNYGGLINLANAESIKIEKFSEINGYNAKGDTYSDPVWRIIVNLPSDSEYRNYEVYREFKTEKEAQSRLKELFMELNSSPRVYVQEIKE